MKTYANEREARHGEALKLCPPIYTDFKLHRLPKFVKDALRAWRKRNDIEFRRSRFYGLHIDAWGLAWLTDRLDNSTVDHWGSATLTNFGTGECFVMQPYGVCADSLREVKDVANDLGLAYIVHPASLHFPGHTFSVILYQREK